MLFTTQLPICITGEDDKTAVGFVSITQTEMKKRKPDKDVLQDGMKRTCAFHQTFCHRNMTAAVLEKFPVLSMQVFVSDFECDDLGLEHDIMHNVLSAPLVADDVWFPRGTHGQEIRMEYVKTRIFVLARDISSTVKSDQRI